MSYGKYFDHEMVEWYHMENILTTRWSNDFIRHLPYNETWQSITFIANSLGDKGPTFKPGPWGEPRGTIWKCVPPWGRKRAEPVKFCIEAIVMILSIPYFRAIHLAGTDVNNDLQNRTSYSKTSLSRQARGKALPS